MDQAGKKLLLITNSDYHYTDKMMQHSFNRFLPNDMSWRDLFDIVSKFVLYYYVVFCRYIFPINFLIVVLNANCQNCMEIDGDLDVFVMSFLFIHEM